MKRTRCSVILIARIAGLTNPPYDVVQEAVGPNMDNPRAFARRLKFVLSISDEEYARMLGGTPRSISRCAISSGWRAEWVGSGSQALILGDQPCAAASVANPAAICGNAPTLTISTSKLSSSRWTIR